MRSPGTVLLRLMISIVCGLLIPVLYTIGAGALTATFPQYLPDTMQMFGEPVPGPILAPTLFPFYLITWLEVNSYFGWGLLLDSMWFRVLATLIPNFLLYSILTYSVLLVFRRRKKMKLVGIQIPPPPPSF